MDSRKSLAVAIINFLKAELESGRLGEEGTEALEVGIQCLETAYCVDDAATTPVDLLKVYETHCPNLPNGGSQENIVVDKEKGEKKKVEGNDFMRDGKFHEAIASYTAAINYDPQNAIYYSNRAAAYAKLNDNKNSILDCEKALDLDPSYSKAYGRMGLAYFNDENYEKAIEAYEHALSLDPANQPYKVQLDSAKEKLTGKKNQANATPSANNPLAGMDLSALLSNPAVMNMAQSFMSSPQVQSMFSNMMSGSGNDQANGGGGSGGVPGAPPGGNGPAPGPGLGGLDFNSVLNATSQFANQLQQQNPDVVDNLRSQFQGSTRPPDGDGGDPK